VEAEFCVEVIKEAEHLSSMFSLIHDTASSGTVTEQQTVGALPVKGNFSVKEGFSPGRGVIMLRKGGNK